MQADQCGLVAKLDALVHVTEGSPGKAGTVRRHGASRKVGIKDEAAIVTHGQHHLLINEGLTDAGENSVNPLDVRARQRLQGAADAAVVGPTGLPPRLCDGCILIERMGS